MSETDRCTACGAAEVLDYTGRHWSNLTSDGRCFDERACDRRVAEDRPVPGTFGAMLLIRAPRR